MDRVIDYRELVPDAYAGYRAVEDAVATTDLDTGLIDVVKLRASQLNGCAYCVDLHTRRAREHGMGERRIAAVAAWRESPFFTDDERAALELTEALTRLADHPPPVDALQDATERFDDHTLAALVIIIAQINAWNRLWVATRTPTILPLDEEA